MNHIHLSCYMQVRNHDYGKSSRNAINTRFLRINFRAEILSILSIAQNYGKSVQWRKLCLGYFYRTSHQSKPFFGGSPSVYPKTDRILVPSRENQSPKLCPYDIQIRSSSFLQFQVWSQQLWSFFFFLSIVLGTLCRKLLFKNF